MSIGSIMIVALCALGFIAGGIILIIKKKLLEINFADSKMPVSFIRLLIIFLGVVLILFGGLLLVGLVLTIIQK